MYHISILFQKLTGIGVGGGGGGGGGGWVALGFAAGGFGAIGRLNSS